MLKWIALFCAIIFTLSACAFITGGNINITDAKIVTAVDENLMPVRITDDFPKGTSKVVCWFQWKDARINLQILAKWRYITDDIHILDYPFYIPKSAGSGSVALSGPEGKPLPAGQYKVDLVVGRHALRSLTFKIE